MMENNRLCFTAQLADSANSARKVAQCTLQAGVTCGFAKQEILALSRPEAMNEISIIEKRCAHRETP
ncbi:hypothetical protein B0E47_12800 [Rhodanobacter sp. B05]|nr:hypothetical protein B0E47_12800 [Rhodanobacter sp. B05]